MYCIKCGTELENGARFCHICGAPQFAADGTKKPQGTRSGRPSENRQRTDGKQKTAADKRTSGRGASSGAGAASARAKTPAKNSPAPQRKPSSSRNLTIVIISIFAIAAAAAVVLFVMAKTGGKQSAAESAVIAQSGNEKEDLREDREDSGNLFDWFRKDSSEDESAEPAEEEEALAGEETQESDLPPEPEETPELATEPEPTETPAPTKEPEPAETPAPAVETVETPVPEAAVTASVRIASQASLSGYKKVSVAYAAATSELKQTDLPGVDNSAHSAVDGDTTTSWQEDIKGYGEGEYLDFRLTKEFKIRAITFNMGNWRNADWYNDNSRPKDITLWLDDQSFSVTIPDGMTQYAVEFSGPVKASEVMVIIDSVYPGRLYDDTCISEITMYAQ